MKKFSIILSSIFVFGCSSYCQNKKIIYDCIIKNTITQEKKFINIEKYQKEFNQRGDGIQLVENDTLEVRISFDPYEITKRIFNKRISVIKALSYGYDSKKIISSLFYYTKGNFNIGKEYQYDLLGNITKVINNDDPENYTICYKEAEAIVLKKMGKKYEIRAFGRENKLINNEMVYYWEVITSKIGSFKDADKREFWIHGKTGKILKVLKCIILIEGYYTEKEIGYKHLLSATRVRHKKSS